MSSYNLKRLLQPKSIALFGGLWVENVATQIKNSSFNGDVWPINPRRKFIAGFKCFKDILFLFTASSDRAKKSSLV